ncbi:pilus assembly protein CpaE [Pseudomonas cichorii]|uniref:hypothetical protein n=1 Tax=Pseudomonas cichorii TaxID=36746 RepID=UPI001910C251|nr:hypothetical protein [Pseudomonas cichorii]GFM81753.1 pilus assembly protein CpaE [Pseudomonas cichorii]
MNDKTNTVLPSGDKTFLAPVLFAASTADQRSFAEQLQRLGQPEALVLSGGIEAAKAWCAEQRASLLLVDLDGEQFPLQAISELSSLCDPGCAILAIGSQQNVDLYRALTHSGVVDYLCKPVPLDLLASSLERARNIHQQPQTSQVRTGRSIAVTACSGGLGTSTVSAGLSLLLSHERHIPVAAVDYDRHNADLSLLLGAQGDCGLAAALSSSEIDARFLQRAMTRLDDRLHLLAQEPSADHFAPIDTDHLLELGANLCRLFNQVVWDLPSGHPQGALEVLRHVETRILLSEFTIQGARNTQRLLEEIGDESEGQQLLLVVNQNHGTHQTVAREQFEAFVGRRVDLILPYAGHALSDSLLSGPLRLEAAPAFRQALLNLADLACGRKPGNALAAPSVLARLKGALTRRNAA